MPPLPDVDPLDAAITARYAAKAIASTGCAAESCADASFGAGQYAADELDDRQMQGPVLSLGCGNPVRVAEVSTGETVLDLGSGAGVDPHDRWCRGQVGCARQESNLRPRA